MSEDPTLEQTRTGERIMKTISARVAVLAVAAAGVLGATALVPPAMAGHSHRGWSDSRAGYDYARVVQVDPIVREFAVEVPVRECWDEVVYHEPRRRRGTAGATIAGGLIGGLVGNQFGSGRGQDAATVVGGLLGATIANDVARENRRRDDYRGYQETIRRCENTTELRYEERVEGYHVTYRYQGREYTTRTLEHPGERIALRVSVTPVG
jgi:uncharacterized protein YcfJ